MLDETYIHAHSKTINTSFNHIEKFKLLYVSCLEFTRKYRKHGNFKASILKPLMTLSILEMRLVNAIHRIFNVLLNND